MNFSNDSPLWRIRNGQSYRAGFTLVELLVVISIIGILMSLLLPAVNAARESARQLQCKNHLKQLGLACTTHLDTNGWFPTGGWYTWTGDPDRGFSRNQPGGWMYNILPYCDMMALHDLGIGVNMGSYNGKGSYLAQQTATPVTFFHCPTRRPAQSYPYNEGTSNASAGTGTNKTDYAINGGNYSNPFTGVQLPGATTCYTTESSCQWSTIDNNYTKYCSGISSLCSQFGDASVKDGMSNTLAIAEKYLPTDDYYDSTNGSDNNSAFQGYDWDTTRWGPAFNGQTTPGQYTNAATRNPTHNTGVVRIPLPDTKGYYSNACPQFFGSAHAAFFFGVMCDGSIRTLNFNISPVILGCMSNRADSAAIDPSKI